MPPKGIDPPRWRRRWLIAIASSALALAACSDGEKPSEPAPASEKVAPAADEPPPIVEHVILPGETLWDIARAYGKTVDEIAEFNELRPRDIRRLKKGGVLRIPGVTEKQEVAKVDDTPTLEQLPELEDGAYHFIAEGETLWDIARTYDRSVDDLLARNEWSDDDVRTLRPGGAVIIPGIKQSDVKTVPQESSAAPRAKGIRHTVARGETVWDLARSFRVSVSELMAANAMSPDDVRNLREGARIWIPGVTEDRGTGKVNRELSTRQKNALAYGKRLGLGSRIAATKLLQGKVDRKWLLAAGGRKNRLPGTLRWPVTHGRFVRGFGSGEGGYHLAVDIIGEIGWNVRAAAAGIVGYSDDTVPGYGNMILVVHEGGWVTMYAHNSVNFVVPGERVPEGGVLAEVGSTGISRGPHVHFELIYNGKLCDPASLFRPGVRHKTRLSSIVQQIWRKPAERPDAIQCLRRRRHPRSRYVIDEDPGSDS